MSLDWFFIVSRWIVDAEIKKGEVKSKGKMSLPWGSKLRRCGFLWMCKVRCEVFLERARQRWKKMLWRLGENEIVNPRGLLFISVLS